MKAAGFWEGVALSIVFTILALVIFAMLVGPDDLARAGIIGRAEEQKKTPAQKDVFRWHDDSTNSTRCYVVGWVGSAGGPAMSCVRLEIKP